MAVQYSQDDIYPSPEFEYKAEELKKRLLCTRANFTYFNFKRSMQKKLEITEET